jgi:hypothetical protein
MNFKSDIGSSYPTMHRQLYNLRGKLGAVHDYSERNFNHLSGRLKVYFEEITSLAAGASMLRDTMAGADVFISDALLGALNQERQEQLRSLFYSFQVIQRQCWKLGTEVEGERNAFMVLSEKISSHIRSTQGASNQYSEIMGIIEEQIAGLESLNVTVTKIRKPIAESVNALFFISKFFDSAEGILKAENLDRDTVASLLHTVCSDAEHCLADINKLVTNIQIHDMVRQRLEHIDQAYEQLLHELASAGDRDPAPQYLPMVPELAKLHVAQLSFTKGECMETFSAIRDVLNTIDERMADALESYVKVSCISKHSDAGFNQRVETLLQESLPLIVENEQNYIKAVGDMQASFRDLKVGLRRVRGCVLDSLNDSAVKSETLFDLGSLYYELQELTVVLRHALLKLGVEAANAIRQFSEVAVLLDFVDGAAGKSHEAFYNRLVLQGGADDENMQEAHDKCTDFFRRKISEVIDDLVMLSQQPRLMTASKEHIQHTLREIEKVYTMQSEREIHHRANLGVLGGAPVMVECAANDENLELF